MTGFLTDALKLTAIYVAGNALIMLVLGMRVVRARVATQTAIGDGGNEAMVRAIRTHGNNVEYVPLPLVMMLAVALLGGSFWLIHAIGAPLTLGRILHAIGLSLNAGTSRGRLLGMTFTWIGFIAGIVALVWLVFAHR